MRLGVEVLEAQMPEDYESGESRPSSMEGTKKFEGESKSKSGRSARSGRSGGRSTRTAVGVAVLAGSKLAEAAPVVDMVVDSVPWDIKLAAAAWAIDAQLIGNMSAWISASL